MPHVPDDLPTTEPRDTQGDVRPTSPGEAGKRGLLESLSIRSFQPDQRLVRDAVGNSSEFLTNTAGHGQSRQPQFLPPVVIKPPPTPTFLQSRREATGVNGFRPK